MSEIVAAWGKSKCGAMRWLVPLVAPLLILPKRWLVLSFVCLFNVCTVVHRVTANVLAVGDGAGCQINNFLQTSAGPGANCLLVEAHWLSNNG